MKIINISEDELTEQLDELLVNKINRLHLEKLDKGVLWLGLYDKDGNRIVLNIMAIKNELHCYVNELI